MVIVIGFSVDYVVHFASDYMSSAEPSRNNKMKQAYYDMGVSIFSGWITSFGSGFFLFFAKIIVFSKFGIIITVTVSISLLVAMLLFGAIMHTCGPQNGCGNIVCCYKKQKKPI